MSARAWQARRARRDHPLVLAQIDGGGWGSDGRVGRVIHLYLRAELTRRRRVATAMRRVKRRARRRDVRAHLQPDPVGDFLLSLAAVYGREVVDTVPL